MQTMGCCLAGGGGRGGGGKGDSADAVAGDGGGGDGDGAGFRLNAEIIKFDSLKLTKHLLTFLSGWRGRSMSRHRTVSSPDFTIQCIDIKDELCRYRVTRLTTHQGCVSREVLALPVPLALPRAEGARCVPASGIQNPFRISSIAATGASNLGLKVTVDPLLDAGPLLLPAALLPQLTLDTGPLDLQFHMFSRTRTSLGHLHLWLNLFQHIRTEALPVLRGVVGSGGDYTLSDHCDVRRRLSPPPNL